MAGASGDSSPNELSLGAGAEGEQHVLKACGSSDDAVIPLSEPGEEDDLSHDPHSVSEESRVWAQARLSEDFRERLLTFSRARMWKNPHFSPETPRENHPIAE